VETLHRKHSVQDRKQHKDSQVEMLRVKDSQAETRHHKAIQAVM